MTLSADGRTLFASDPTAAYSWAYNPTTGTAAHQTTLVTGMNTDDHTTRTLLLSDKAENTLLISRGSTSNIDPLASDISTGHSQIKAFNLEQVPANGYQFNTDGVRLGYVHLGAHPSDSAYNLSCKTRSGSKRKSPLPRLVLYTSSSPQRNNADSKNRVDGVFATQLELPSILKPAGYIQLRTPRMKSSATVSMYTKITQVRR